MKPLRITRVVDVVDRLNNTEKTGKSMRAYSDNEDLALLSGIDPKIIILITWIIVSILDPGYQQFASFLGYIYIRVAD